MDAEQSQLHYPPDSNITTNNSDLQRSQPPLQPQASYQDHYSVQDSRYDHQFSRINNAGRFTEEWDASQRGGSIIDAPSGKIDTMQRSASVHSYAAGDDEQLPLRGNTLRKKSSLRHGSGSIRRSSSRRSTRAGSVKSLALQSASDPDEAHSAFYCPVPTSGSPTEVLSERFQTWRKILKDLIAYFREIQSHYEQRSKALVKLSNVSNNISTPQSFLRSAGIDDALQMLRVFNKSAILEANKAKEIEEDVILALTGLRSDLQQKIKEIKHLSGDFKNSVQKEMDNTSKAVSALADVLDKNEADSASTTGKQDPFLLRLAVDRQVERQIDEENYLHQAYLNLEGSGRELESIVLGEIQKAYNAYAGILKREADNALNVVGELREGPIAMPKDQEWIHFVTHEDRVVDPTMPLRTPDQIHYPGQEHIAAQEIRAGLLERKSKYLKSYTAGWYVLSTTHLHEFKSADKGQAPIMSLYLPEQKLGSHSEEGSSSSKFILKGRQTGTMHRGHTWVFRAESHDTMLAWYEDIKALTEKSPEERSQFVRTHSRSLSRSSRRSARSVSSDGLDDEDEEPFSGSEVVTNPVVQPDMAPRRPQPGGRFPSDLQINAQRGLLAPQSPSSISSGNQALPSDTYVVAASRVPSGADAQDNFTQDERNHMSYGGTNYTQMEEMSSQAAIANQEAQYDGVNPYTSEPIKQVESGVSGGGSIFVAPVAASPQRPEDDLSKFHEGGDQEPSLAKHTTTTTTDTSILAGLPPIDSDEKTKTEIFDNATTGGDEDYITAINATNPPISEALTPTDTQGLQAVPELETADHTTPAELTVGELPKRSNRPSDHRTDSVTTISNLPIPGGYPKVGAGGVITNAPQ